MRSSTAGTSDAARTRRCVAFKRFRRAASAPPTGSRARNCCLFRRTNGGESSPRHKENGSGFPVGNRSHFSFFLFLEPLDALRDEFPRLRAAGPANRLELSSFHLIIGN